MNKYDEIREMQNLTLDLLQEHIRGNVPMLNRDAPTLPNFKVKIQTNLDKLPNIAARLLQRKIQLLKDFYSQIGTPKFVFHSVKDNIPFNKTNLQEYDYKGIIKSAQNNDLGLVFDADTDPDYRVAMIERIKEILNS